MQTKPEYFEGFNFLRFFAALAIVFYHVLIPYSNTVNPSYALFLKNLAVGVDFFFLISGFLIVYLLAEEKRISNKINLLNFYVRRILRIFPLYFLIILIAVLEHGTDINYQPFLYFWGNISIANIEQWPVAILTPLWSICVEEHFYVFIPLVVSLLPFNYLKYALYGIVILSLGFRLYTYYTDQYPWFTIYVHTLSKIDVIALGGIIAINYKQLTQRIKIGSWSFLIVFAIIPIYMLIVNNNDFSTLASILFKKYLLTIPFILIILLVLYTDNRIVNIIRKNKMFDYLGKCSFGIYVFHSPVNTFLGKVGITNTALYLIIVVIITIIVSIVSYEYFEKQFLKLRKYY
jgi:peptidoglycan/LPS O-acetylase OafA/YrhL